jgi:hypothetical protein
VTVRSWKAELIFAWAAVLLGLATLTWTGSASGQLAPDDREGPPEGSLRADTAVDDGAFLPFAMSARSDAQHVLVASQGGYDSALGSPQVAGAVQGQLLGRLTLRAGASYVGPEHSVRPEASLKVDALRQAKAGLDLAAAAGYEAYGFNTTPAVTLRLAAARLVGRTKLLANVGVGVGTEEGERYGDLRLSAMRRVLPALQLGLDSRFRIDLERDTDEPEGEAEWDVAAGPVLAFTFSRLVLSATAGPSALKLRFGAGELGAFGALGLGAVF